MKAPSIIYAHEVVRRLSDNEDLEESVLRDSSGADVAYRIRSGKFIAIWDVATKHLRIYGNDARPMAGLTEFESGSRG